MGIWSCGKNWKSGKKLENGNLELFFAQKHRNGKYRIRKTEILKF
tara:strand:+ start:98 stop:232 length:135 start_codon:yes stop_codon:yes gene_type:complete